VQRVHAFRNGSHHLNRDELLRIVKMKPVLPCTHFGFPYDWTEADRAAASAIVEMRELRPPPKFGNQSPWSQYISQYPTRDFLGDLYYAKVIPSDADWARLTSFEFKSYNDRVIVAQTLQALDNRLTDNLLRLTSARISHDGGIIYYTDRLDRCLVYDYSFGRSTNAARVGAVAQIVNPDLLYDVDSAMSGKEAGSRRALKNALVYGHKIVAHRNTIVHVDRRRDEGTAGPYIDTMVLNEILHRYIYEWARDDSSASFRSAAEIGSGCGLLIAACGQHMPSALRLFAVDPSMAAVACTHRNFFANNRLHVKRRFIGICSKFEDTDLKNLDLVMCNPPYVPERPEARKRTAPNANFGTELLEQIVRKAPDFLSDNGLLFLIFSDLAWKEFEAAVPEGIEYEQVGPESGFRVQFDLTEVLEDELWVQFLVERGLDYNRATEACHHHLKCVVVHKREDRGFKDAQAIERIRTLNRGFSRKHVGG